MLGFFLNRCVWACESPEDNDADCWQTKTFPLDCSCSYSPSPAGGGGGMSHPPRAATLAAIRPGWGRSRKVIRRRPVDLELPEAPGGSTGGSIPPAAVGEHSEEFGTHRGVIAKGERREARFHRGNNCCTLFLRLREPFQGRWSISNGKLTWETRSYVNVFILPDPRARRVGVRDSRLLQRRRPTTCSDREGNRY